MLFDEYCYSVKWVCDISDITFQILIYAKDQDRTEIAILKLTICKCVVCIEDNQKLEALYRAWVIKCHFKGGMLQVCSWHLVSRIIYLFLGCSIRKRSGFLKFLIFNLVSLYRTIGDILNMLYIVVATTSRNDPVVCLLQQSSYLAI